MSSYVKGTLVEAALNAVLITILLLPFQILMPQFAPYTPFLIIPAILFFALRLPPRGLVPMVLSFLVGVAWGMVFALIGGPLIAAQPASAPLVLGVGVTLLVFAILAVHPLLLHKTPLSVVPAVLLGFVESLLVILVLSQIRTGPGAPTPLAPPIGLLAIAGFFIYGAAMIAIMIPVTAIVTDAVAGKDWNPRRAPNSIETHIESA